MVMEYFTEKATNHSVCEIPHTCETQGHVALVKDFIRDHLEEALAVGKTINMDEIIATLTASYAIPETKVMEIIEVS